MSDALSDIVHVAGREVVGAFRVRAQTRAEVGAPQVEGEAGMERGQARRRRRQRELHQPAVGEDLERVRVEALEPQLLAEVEARRDRAVVRETSLGEQVE